MSSCPKFKILLAENEGMYLDSYVYRFKNIEKSIKNIEFRVTGCFDYKDAIDKINSQHFDLVLLALHFKSSKNDAIWRGEEIARILRVHHPTTKIVVNTFIDNSFRLHQVFKNIDPEGVFFKADMNNIIFEHLMINVLEGLPAYSPTILEFMRNESQISDEIDENDRLIIDCLSRGMTTPAITEHVPLSTSGIENRKRRLAKIFGLETTETTELIRVARKKGLC